MATRLWSIEGNTQRLDGGSMFGNVPRALWSRWIAPDDAHRIPLACRALLAALPDGRRILFETGIGAFFDPAMKERFGVVEKSHVLLDSLAGLGLEHTDIDVVVLSHLHFDHAGGLLAAWAEDTEPALLFPNARYIVSRRHWERARDPHPRDRASFVPAIQTLLEASGRLELVDGAHSPTLGELVRFSYSDGHTPGLMLAEIVGPGDGNGDGTGSGNGGVVYCADLIPGRPWVHLPVTMGYDRAPEQLIDEKRQFLEDKLARGVRLFFTHDPEACMASVGRDERGRFRAEDPQSRITGLRIGGA